MRFRYFIYAAILCVGAAMLNGCSMTAGGDMSTTTQVNPTVDTKFNNVGQ